MSSRTDIERLVYRYAECIDSGDFEGLARLFANGRMLAPDGSVLAEGFDDMLAFLKETVRIYPDSGTPKSQHVMSNLVIDVDDGADIARATCYYTVFQRADDLPLQAVIGGRYRDRFRRSESDWRFEERQTLPLLFGDLSQHVLRFPEPGPSTEE